MGLYLSEYGHFQIISRVLAISHQITNCGTFTFYILGKANEILFHSNGSGAYFLILNKLHLGLVLFLLHMSKLCKEVMERIPQIWEGSHCFMIFLSQKTKLLFVR